MIKFNGLGIRSLKHYNILIKSCPSIEGIDLSDNKLERVDEFANLRGLKLKVLFVSRNPLTSAFAGSPNPTKAAIDKFKTYFPSLKRLDGYIDFMCFRTFMTIHRAPPDRYGTYLEYPDAMGLVQELISSVIRPWDFSKEEQLSKCYGGQSCVSVSVCGKGPKPFATMPNDAVRNLARNGGDSVEVAGGPHEAFLLFKKLPKIAIDDFSRSNVTADVSVITLSEDGTRQVLVINLYGNCYVGGSASIFTRTIVFEWLKRIIINDAICFHDLKSGFFAANLPNFQNKTK